MLLCNENQLIPLLDLRNITSHSFIHHSPQLLVLSEFNLDTNKLKNFTTTTTKKRTDEKIHFMPDVIDKLDYLSFSSGYIKPFAWEDYIFI